MKVGILTFHWADNYGAVLQAYALTKRIKGFCDEKDTVEIVNYTSPLSAKIYGPFYYRHAGLFADTKSLMRCVKNFPSWIYRRIGFQSFRKKMPISEVYTRSKLLESESKYDIWITGSDQVWNTEIVKSDYDIYDLSFVHSEKKCSYAASSGLLDVINNNIQRKLVSDIGKLDLISVRELSTKKDLEELIGKRIVNVMDPTFLISKEEWEALSSKKRIHKNRYIFVYYISCESELIKTAIRVSEVLGLDIVVCGRLKPLRGIAKEILHASPEVFLNLIKNAEFVVASSFHATAFSIIFEKQFLSLVPSYASNRVQDLCDLVGLSSRVVQDASSTDELLREKIDYKEITPAVKKEVEKSETFLHSLLK